MTRSRGINNPKKFWTEDELVILTHIYPTTFTATIAKFFNCRLDQIYRKADALNLKKNRWYQDSPMAQRLRTNSEIGIPYRFKKGQVSANKGKKCISHPNMVPTQFKPGQRPHTWREIGSERITKDGYIQLKMTDTGYPPRDWKGVHIVIWERLHGMPMPKSHMVAFRDGNKTNFAPENLELLSRSENMSRNTYHRYGKDIAQIYQLKGAITRQINKMGLKNE